jgi:uncharacterized protein
MESTSVRVGGAAPPPAVLAGAPREPRFVPLWAVSAALWLIVLLIVIARHAGLANVPAVATFGVIFTSIVIEAMPFILLGAIVSALIAVYVPDRTFAAIARLPHQLQLPAATVAGFAFPVCECGSVPVGRRLISRGLYPAAALGFMLGAPIFNPIVLSATFVAYGGGQRGLEMTVGRAGLGLLVAMTAAMLIARWGGSDLVRPRSADQDHDHSAEHMDRRESFIGHLVNDFLFMGKYLMIGAALAALLQTVVPQSILSGIADAPVIGALALMGFAFMLSLCSEADAFVATSFTGFPLGSQLAFLVLGPVIDTKLAVLYGATFKRGFVARLLAITVPLVLIGSLAYAAVVL